MTRLILCAAISLWMSNGLALADTCSRDVSAAYRAMVLKEYDATLSRGIGELDSKKKGLCAAHRAVIKADRALAHLTSKYSCLPTQPDHWLMRASEAEKLLKKAGCQ